MKVTIELNTEDEIKTFYERMFAPDKPHITMYATPAIEPDPAPQELPEGFMPAPENVPFEDKPTPKAPEPAPAPKPAPLSFDMVQAAAIKLVQAKKQEELRSLLQKYGVQALPELKDKPDDLAAFYKDLEVM